MISIRTDRICLAPTVGVDQRNGDEVGVWNGMGVGNGKRVFEDGFDRTPNVDDLVAGFMQLGSFKGQVVCYA